MPRGVPQIEITYDLDANGILTVSAVEKSTGKTEQIKVENDKGRLTREEIDKMLADAERFKDDDEKAKNTIEARNSYEGLVFQMKSSIEDEKTGTSIPENLKEKLMEIIDTHNKWLEVNQSVSKEEYESRKAEFIEAMKPLQDVLMKGSMPQQPNGEQYNGEPKIDDID